MAAALDKQENIFVTNVKCYITMKVDDQKTNRKRLGAKVLRFFVTAAYFKFFLPFLNQFHKTILTSTKQIIFPVRTFTYYIDRNVTN